MGRNKGGKGKERGRRQLCRVTSPEGRGKKKKTSPKPCNNLRGAGEKKEKKRRRGGKESRGHSPPRKMKRKRKKKKGKAAPSSSCALT